MAAKRQSVCGHDGELERVFRVITAQVKELVATSCDFDPREVGCTYLVEQFLSRDIVVGGGHKEHGGWEIVAALNAIKKLRVTIPGGREDGFDSSIAKPLSKTFYLPWGAFISVMIIVAPAFDLWDIVRRTRYGPGGVSTAAVACEENRGRIRAGKGVGTIKGFKGV